MLPTSSFPPPPPPPNPIIPGSPINPHGPNSPYCGQCHYLRSEPSPIWEEKCRKCKGTQRVQRICHGRCAYGQYQGVDAQGNARIYPCPIMGCRGGMVESICVECDANGMEKVVCEGDMWGEHPERVGHQQARESSDETMDKTQGNEEEGTSSSDDAEGEEDPEYFLEAMGDQTQRAERGSSSSDDAEGEGEEDDPEYLEAMEALWRLRNKIQGARRGNSSSDDAEGEDDEMIDSCDGYKRHRKTHLPAAGRTRRIHQARPSQVWSEFPVSHVTSSSVEHAM